VKQIRFTVTSGTPTEEERAALEQALLLHETPQEEQSTKKSKWAEPTLRQPLSGSF